MKDIYDYLNDVKTDFGLYKEENIRTLIKVEKMVVIRTENAKKITRL